MRSRFRTALVVLVAMLASAAVTATPALATGKPFVETKPATGINRTEANLNGVVNPNGLATKYYFEYGTTLAYGKATAEGSAGSGSSNVGERTTISGLIAKTSYHFRIVATNSYGTTDGADQVFATTNQEPSNCHKKAGSGNRTLCINGTPQSKSIEFTSRLKSASVVLELPQVWGGTPRDSLICKARVGQGAFTELPLKIQYGLDLNECRLEGPISTTCKVQPEPIGESLAGTFNSVENVAIAPAAGITLFTFTIGNIEHCGTLVGTYHVDGTYKCALRESELEATEHELTCESDSRALELNHIEAYEVTLRYAQVLALGGVNEGKNFSIYEK